MPIERSEIICIVSLWEYTYAPSGPVGSGWDDQEEFIIYQGVFPPPVDLIKNRSKLDTLLLNVNTVIMELVTPTGALVYYDYSHTGRISHSEYRRLIKGAKDSLARQYGDPT